MTDLNRGSGMRVVAVVALLLAPSCAGQGGGAADGEDTAAVPDSGQVEAELLPDSLRPGREPETAGAAPTDRPDSARAGRYFVRLRHGADPRTVAERHGVLPDTVYLEEARAFVAVLTWGQVEALRADTLVRSLAPQIE